MNVAGIIVLIVGIVFAILVLVLMKVLLNVASTLKGINESVNKLPEQVEQGGAQVNDIFSQANDALTEVNKQIASHAPIVYIIANAGERARNESSSLVDMTMSFTGGSAQGTDVESRNNLGAVYESALAGYYLFQKRNALKEGLSSSAE